MEQLLARLLVPLAVMLVLSAVGIAVLAADAMRRRATDEESSSALPRQGRSLASTLGRSIVEEEDEDPHDTLVIDRRALRASMQGLPQFRSRGAPQDLRGPDADFRGVPSTRSSEQRRPPDFDDEPPPPPPRRSDVFDSGRRRSETSQPVRNTAPPAGRDSLAHKRGDLFDDDEPPQRSRDSAIRKRGDMFDPRSSKDGEDGPPSRTGSPLSKGGPRDTASRKRGEEFDAPGRSTRRGDMFDPPSRKSPPPPREEPDESGRTFVSSRDELFNPPPPRSRSSIFSPPEDEPENNDPPTRRVPSDMFDPPARGSLFEAPTEDPRSRQRGDIFDRPRPSDSRVLDKGRDSGELARRTTGKLPPSGRLPGGNDGDRRTQPVGVNIVLQQPLAPRGFQQVPGKLEVIYGNFSPNDPREIPLFWPQSDTSAPRFVFSKSAGGGVGHIQLNHYTITPTVQADLTYENGRHTLGNMVAGDEMDRYQIRVNGVPMGLSERVTLHSGDIISMGIYRLKLIV